MKHPICLFAHYDVCPEIASYTRHYLRQIASCGFHIHVALSGRPPLDEASRSALHAGLEGLAITFHTRPNSGLDFGAWQYLLQHGIADDADEILLANDSVFGPLAPLAPLVDAMRAQRLDAWGMVRSQAVVEHLQSWFVVLTGETLRRPAIQRIFAQPFNEMSKDEIVLHGELGLGLAMQAERLHQGACWSSARGLAKLLALNPMHTDWRTVLHSGRAPFIKTELLRDNPSAILDTDVWPTMIPDRDFFKPEWIERYLAEHPRRTTLRTATWRGRLVQALAAEDRWQFAARLIRRQFKMRA